MITYQVLAEQQLNEYEYDSEVIFESKTYKEAKAEYDDLLGLYDGESRITLIKNYHDGSSDILDSKVNPYSEDTGEYEVKSIDE